MLAATSTSSPTTRIRGSIRRAASCDAPELARLFEAARIGTVLAQLDRERGHLLVLDLDGSLRAAEYVEIDDQLGCARLQVLVVDPALDPCVREVEDRMRGVALALCEAFGCTCVGL
jgi:hypothetical protein